jgi:uncharacterized Tic20 family protein
MNTIPTTEDRIWAVISHLSALAFGMGIVLPIVGWADQRRKSNYASFQSLQALGYQSLGYTIWLLSYLVIIILASIILLVMLGRTDGTRETVVGPGMIVFFILVFGFFALYFLLPIIAAIACALGRDFRYPFMGDRLAGYLGYHPHQKSEEQVWLIEDHEFCWVAGMGHFSILVFLWGMLAPLTAWILCGKHSFFLKFQSIQTIVYQAATTILYFVALFMYLFGFLLLAVAMGAVGQPDLNSEMGIFGIVIFGALLLISFLIILTIPLLHILGQWAGYRVLKGDNYHYPLIGRLVEKSLRSRLESETPSEPLSEMKENPA